MKIIPVLQQFHFTVMIKPFSRRIAVVWVHYEFVMAITGTSPVKKTRTELKTCIGLCLMNLKMTLFSKSSIPSFLILRSYISDYCVRYSTTVRRQISNVCCWFAGHSTVKIVNKETPNTILHVTHYSTCHSQGFVLVYYALQSKLENLSGLFYLFKFSLLMSLYRISQV